MTSAMSSWRKSYGIGARRSDLACAQAEAVEAGVECSAAGGGAARPAPSAAHARTSSRLDSTGIARRFAHMLLGARQEAVEHVDGGAGRERAGAVRLLQRRDEERCGSRHRSSAGITRAAPRP